MAKNAPLRRARNEKNDEFYTRMIDIKQELPHYKQHFKRKVVYLNCDDPRISMFWKYFVMRFHILGLKKLVATHVSPNGGRGRCWEYKGKVDKKGFPKPPKKGFKLNGDGSFDSGECKVILRQADIVVTNPPFSLMRAYVVQLMDFKKKFLVVGSPGVMTYKETFPYIKDERIWRGVTAPKKFTTPGKGELKMGNTKWITNLEHNGRKKENIILTRKYKGNEHAYPKYNDHDAINVDKVRDIPYDYEGVMGVPENFFRKYNSDQFEIVGIATDNLSIPGRNVFARVFIRNKHPK